MLHEVVRGHLGTFLATEPVPAQARRAVRRYLDCGVLATGFVRVRCPECRSGSVVAFSRKDRASARRAPRRLDWATLLRRVFLMDVLACVCGGTGA